MTGRDRTVLIVVVVAAILGAAWVLVVSPERTKAGQLNTQVAEAQAELASAEGKVSSARAAQSQYASAYASLVDLGKAVPPSQEVPALIDQLTRASDQKNVDFSSITDSGSSASSAASSAGAASASSAAAAAGFTQLPFSFVFEGSYVDLERLFNQLTAFADFNSTGDLRISGRLLTIQSVRLSPENTSSETRHGAGELTGSVTATAYVLPASQGLTGATSPTGASASPASSAAPASSATSPAIVRVNP